MAGQKINWDQLIAAGVPLFADNVALLTLSWEQLSVMVKFAIQSRSLSYREDEALQGWLIALRDHYHSTYSFQFNDAIIRKFVDKRPLDGRLIKLRRLASSRLSKVA